MDKPRLKILSMYALTGVAALLGGVPHYTAQNLSLSLALIGLIIVYAIRHYSKEDSLEHHHYTFIIRSIWIYSLIGAIGMIGASWTVFQKADASAIDTLLDQVNNGMIPDEAMLEAAGQDYFASNKSLILESVILWMFPALIYLMWRVARGSVRAYKNYRIVNIYSWL